MKTEDCIFFQLAKASQTGTRFFYSRVVEFGITAVQSMTLNCLYEQDNIPSSHLGGRVQLDSATLTGILDRLEGSGLLYREKNPDDRRSVLICLTDKGREISEKLQAIVEQANKEYLSNLTNEEQMIFRVLLKKINP